MRPGKLYIKILVSFFTVLFASLILIFALFIALPSKHFTTRLEQYTNTKALIVQKVVEDKIRSAPATDLSRNEPLKDFISDFGDILGGKVWLQRSDGTIPLQSFPGEIPEVVARLEKRSAVAYGNVNMYHRRGLGFYAVVPVSFPGGETGDIHVLFDRLEGPSHPGRGFALGLFIIGLTATLLIVPVSRIITNRLRQLRQSALQIAGGNLSHRAVIRGRDEIGELALSFNRMADKLETMIMTGKELTANVSHELRTPLTRIRVAEEMLRQDLEKSKDRGSVRHLDRIREDIAELDNLIGRILELSKLDIHEAPLTFERVDPAELMHDLIRRLQPVIDRKMLHVSSESDFKPPFSADRDALRTAMLNVLENAVKFTPEKGRITVLIRSERDLLEISVTNTCEPVPEDELSRIFDPFHRVRGAKAAGSGLGLAITGKIVERHGGTIEARNSENGLEILMSIPNHPGS